MRFGMIVLSIPYLYRPPNRAQIAHERPRIVDDAF